VAKKRKNRKSKKSGIKKEKTSRVLLPEESKKWILGIIVFVIATIIALSFFDLAGVAGEAIMEGLTFLIGKAVFVVPLVLVLGGLVFLNTRYEKYFGPAVFAIFILIIGITGILASLNSEVKQGGWTGFIFSWPFLRFFGTLVTQIVFGGTILVGLLIFRHLLKQPAKEKGLPEAPAKESLIKKIFVPKFKIKEVEPKTQESQVKIPPPSDFKTKEVSRAPIEAWGEYKSPPLDLLETDKGAPSAGDIVVNSKIIKKTLENFGLSVEMSEINVGPTVTQYTLKPAEGIKLSKITALTNNLSLALASHPIRIEAPIPGKSLVGIEIPNRERCQVRLRDLISDPRFQNAVSNLSFVLGRDVSGGPCYADLARMPHLLVAGSTGTGKTIFLNSLILSLLYQNSPEILRFILIDPKRVEFSAYKDLPHLLTPVIFDPQKTINALHWLVSEMERRFEVLSGNGSRDIASYNRKVLKEGKELLPYIVLIIDELADLMAAKGREMEVGIVRLAQMARAVGVHLIVATQRPSVEVITGLIKANITSRVTFQVATQVDSRTVLDMAGAEKLLGLGDLLFISAETTKPKRIQGSFVSEKEVRKVVDWIKSEVKTEKLKFGEEAPENHLSEDLQKSLEITAPTDFESFSEEDDPLYEEAKKVVIESRKASASLLQRRLRVGYARAARLIDLLEERGVVGPGEGAKPREVYLENKEEGWQKI
jgi:S-DNA-T family DNA segregation ATPase FtsK/SpoIIIE